jgi:hypothetical protein
MRIAIILTFSLLVFRPVCALAQTESDSKKVGITFSFPWINYYHYVDYQKKVEAKKFGFFGVGLGVYYKKNYTKISFNANTTDDLASPIAQINYSNKGPQTSIGSTYAELLYQHPIYQKIYLIGGLNFTNYSFHFTSGTDSIPSYIKKTQALGISAGMEYRFDNNFSVAAVYRPAIESFETDNFYRHLITLELKIDIDVKKLKH